MRKPGGCAKQSRIDMIRRWREIEEEYGEPIKDVILAYREDGNPWHVIAGALGVSDTTLCHWRKHLDIPLTDHQHGLRFPVERGRRHVDKHAREAGYQDVEEAIYELRVGQGLTWEQVGARLGLNARWLQHLAPAEIKGEYHLSKEGHEYKRQWSETMRLRAHTKSREVGHPWRNDEDIRIAACRAKLSEACEATTRDTGRSRDYRGPAEPTENAEFLLVRTCGPFWMWHETRRLWQAVRGRKARRRNHD